MELTPGVAVSGVFVTCCYAKYIFLTYCALYDIFNKYENGVLQCKNIDLEAMVKSLRLTWSQRPFLVNYADHKFFSCNSELTKGTRMLLNISSRLKTEGKNYLWNRKKYKKIIVYTGVEEQRRNLENRFKNAAICITTEFEENGSSRYLDGWISHVFSFSWGWCNTHSKSAQKLGAAVS